MNLNRFYVGILKIKIEFGFLKTELDFEFNLSENG